MSEIERRVASLTLRQAGYPRAVRLSAAAITLSEMHFRPFPIRALEFTYAILLLLFRRKISHLTLGVSQISVRHVTNKHQINEFQALKKLASAESSIQMCCELLSDCRGADIHQLISFYNGNASAFYQNRTQTNFQKLIKVFGK